MPGDTEHASSTGDVTSPLLDCTRSENVKALPIYTTIYRIRHDIITQIYDPYSVDQLKAPRLNYSVLRPLVEYYYSLQDISIVYCLLVNRRQFIRDQSYQAHHQTVDTTRAALCELIAVRILRRFDEENPGTQGLLLLGHIMIRGFDPFQNAPAHILEDSCHTLPWSVPFKGGYERKLSALEVGIVSESKAFLCSASCQKLVDAVYKGKLIFTPVSLLDILPDHYKNRPIAIYDPVQAPLLNQYRLIVPRIRDVLEIMQFTVLLTLYILAMANRSQSFNVYEVTFSIYSSGWILDQCATILEHGWKVYTQNLWSFLDVIFAAIFCVYFGLRLQGYIWAAPELTTQALDILATAAPFLVPRLAFNLMSSNMLFVSLRAMMTDFAILTVLAFWCFGGFLLSLFWLGDGVHDPLTISKWMWMIWFGLDGQGLEASRSLHNVLGPSLMIAFAFLGNTLFLTVLVAMLTTTFANIASNVHSEIAFRRTVLTFEGVKSDGLFAYFPPTNLVALVLLLPLKLMLTPRWFHKVNVTAVRILNAPVLLTINILERQALWRRTEARLRGQSKSPSRFAFWDMSRFNVHGGIQAVFDFEPPHSALDDREQDEGIARGKARQISPSARRPSSQLGEYEMIHEIMPEHHTKALSDRMDSMEESLRGIERILEKMMSDGNDVEGDAM